MSAKSNIFHISNQDSQSFLDMCRSCQTAREPFEFLATTSLDLERLYQGEGPLLARIFGCCVKFDLYEQIPRQRQGETTQGSWLTGVPRSSNGSLQYSLCSLMVVKIL